MSNIETLINYLDGRKEEHCIYFDCLATDDDETTLRELIGKAQKELNAKGA